MLFTIEMLKEFQQLEASSILTKKEVASFEESIVAFRVTPVGVMVKWDELYGPYEAACMLKLKEANKLRLAYQGKVDPALLKETIVTVLNLAFDSALITAHIEKHLPPALKVQEACHYIKMVKGGAMWFTPGKHYEDPITAVRATASRFGL